MPINVFVKSVTVTTSILKGLWVEGLSMCPSRPSLSQGSVKVLHPLSLRVKSDWTLRPLKGIPSESPSSNPSTLAHTLLIRPFSHRHPELEITKPQHFLIPSSSFSTPLPDDSSNLHYFSLTLRKTLAPLVHWGKALAGAACQRETDILLCGFSGK